MGIYEMLGKNSPYQVKVEKEKQTEFTKLVEANKELFDKSKDLEQKIYNATCYLITCINTYEYLDIDSVLLHTYNLLNDKPLTKEQYLRMTGKENEDGKAK